MRSEWREKGVPAGRTAIRSLNYEKSQHPLLVLQRYLKRHKPLQRDNRTTMPEEELLDAVCKLKVPPAYQTAFERWSRHAQSMAIAGERVCFSLTTAAPIALGLGNASPLEVGITLHYTYGMPIIPGSALKGLCRRGALRLVKEEKITQSEFEYLFGTGGDQNAAAGAVVFYDAWYDPNSVCGEPFHRDVITVHHPQYYSSRGTTLPTDFDDPNPVPFLVIKPKAKFLFVLDAVSADWAQFTKQLLCWCLANLGVGAKTNAGYGYFVPTQQSSESQPKVTTWENVTITYEPGPKRLKATNKDGKKAQAEGEKAERLLATLPPDARESLKRNKRLTADLQVLQEGNLLQIEAITPKG